MVHARQSRGGQQMRVVRGRAQQTQVPWVDKEDADEDPKGRSGSEWRGRGGGGKRCVMCACACGCVRADEGITTELWNEGRAVT